MLLGFLILISTYWCTTGRALLFSVSIFAEDVYIHAYIHTYMLNYPLGSQQASNHLDTGNSTALCPEKELLDSARDMICFVSTQSNPISMPRVFIH
jgi:hypothetical protein